VLNVNASSSCAGAEHSQDSCELSSAETMAADVARYPVDFNQLY
jgi:hypothetical protein